MKKVVILFLIFFLNQCITFAKDGSITLDLGKNPNKVASGKLYSFILKNENFSEQKAKNDYAITENNTFADFVDLNNDGKPEIIGYNSATYFQGLTGVCLYILKADKTGNYGVISGLINFYPKDKIRISSKITNEFHDFIITSSINNTKGGFPYIIKPNKFVVSFDGQTYSNIFQENQLREVIKNIK